MSVPALRELIAKWRERADKCHNYPTYSKLYRKSGHRCDGERDCADELEAAMVPSREEFCPYCKEPLPRKLAASEIMNEIETAVAIGKPPSEAALASQGSQAGAASGEPTHEVPNYGNSENPDSKEVTIYFYEAPEQGDNKAVVFNEETTALSTAVEFDARALCETVWREGSADWELDDYEAEIARRAFAAGRKAGLESAK